MPTVIKVSPSIERTIQAQEGDDFSLVMAVKNSDNSDYNFTDHSAKMQVKTRPVETDGALIDFNVELTTGQIQITASAEAMLGKSGKHYYDLKITNASGKVTTWLRGIFEILPTVTV